MLAIKYIKAKCLSPFHVRTQAALVRIRNLTLPFRKNIYRGVILCLCASQERIVLSKIFFTFSFSGIPQAKLVLQILIAKV